MEKVIDRKEYRRSSEKENKISDEQINIWQRKIKKVLFQSLCAAICFLISSILKINGCTDFLTSINSYLDSEITISSLQENGQRIAYETNKYYNKVHLFIEELIGENNAQKQENVFIELEDSGEKISSGETFNVILSEAVHTQYESAVEGINQMSEDAKYIKENYEFIKPVIGTVTSTFGVRKSSNPIVSVYHSGLDIAANTGTQIIAAIEGEVIEAGTDIYYGKYLKIKRDDIVMIYAHCSKLLVKKGDSIKKGSLIAYVGNTGNSTGPHLHFEVRYKDRLVNPEDILEI